MRWAGTLLRNFIDSVHGVQYAASAYTTALQQVQAQSSMAEVGEAWQNGCAARTIGTIEEEVGLADDRDCHDACRQSRRFPDDVYRRTAPPAGHLMP